MGSIRKMIFPVIALTLLLGCSDRGGKVVAEVNGQKITLNEMERSLKVLAMSGRPVNDAVKKNVLEQMVSKALLMEEAERMGITKDEMLLWKIEMEKDRIILDELLRRQVNTLVTVTDDEVKQVYDQQLAKAPKGKTLPPFDKIKDGLRQQLFKQKQRDAFNNLVQNLRSKAQISVNQEVLQSAQASK